MNLIVLEPGMGINEALAKPRRKQNAKFDGSGLLKTNLVSRKTARHAHIPPQGAVGVALAKHPG